MGMHAVSCAMEDGRGLLGGDVDVKRVVASDAPPSINTPSRS